MSRATRLLALAALGGFGALRHLGRTWGSTVQERRGAMPGDDIVARPFGVTDHAVTVAAPPDDVWPWIVQMGYHRAGWYTPAWVDRWIWHIDNPSSDRILPGLQGLAVGDVVPDGEPGTASYDVVSLEPERLLVLHSTSHVPPALRDVMSVDWTWSFLLEPVETGTRLRLRARASGSSLALLAWHLLVVPSDFVMARAMLRGIAERAEHSAPRRPATSRPA